jgi:hypothetical protein
LRTGRIELPSPGWKPGGLPLTYVRVWLKRVIDGSFVCFLSYQVNTYHKN